MKQITKTTTLYNFSELSQEAQDKVIERQRNINTDDSFWCDFVIENAKECGKLIGIDIKNVYFSGFSSQGDGACFEGEYSHNKKSAVKIKKYAPCDKELHGIANGLSKIQNKHGYSLTASVKQSGHYNHSGCTEIDVMTKDYQYPDEDTQDTVSQLLRDFMDWIYSQLEKQYEYFTSREAIIKTIEANGYTFEIDGKMNNG